MQRYFYERLSDEISETEIKLKTCVNMLQKWKENRTSDIYETILDYTEGLLMKKVSLENKYTTLVKDNNFQGDPKTLELNKSYQERIQPLLIEIEKLSLIFT